MKDEPDFFSDANIIAEVQDTTGQAAGKIPNLFTHERPEIQTNPLLILAPTSGNQHSLSGPAIQCSNGQPDLTIFPSLLYAYDNRQDLAAGKCAE